PPLEPDAQTEAVFLDGLPLLHDQRAGPVHHPAARTADAVVLPAPDPPDELSPDDRYHLRLVDGDATGDRPPLVAHGGTDPGADRVLSCDRLHRPSAWPYHGLGTHRCRATDDDRAAGHPYGPHLVVHRAAADLERHPVRPATVGWRPDVGDDPVRDT